MSIVSNFIDQAENCSLGSVEGFFPLAVGEKIAVRVLFESSSPFQARNGMYEVVSSEKKISGFPGHRGYDFETRINYVLRKVEEKVE